MPTFTTNQLIDRAKTGADIRDNFVTPDEWKTWATLERYSLDLLLAKSGWHQNFATFTFTREDNFPTSQATISTATDFTLGGPIATNAGSWTATLGARAEGSAGNNIALSIYQTAAGPGTFELRDNEIYNGIGWDPQPNTVGVLIPGTVTTVDLESLFDDSDLLEVLTPDPSQEDLVAATVQHDALTSGGANGLEPGDYLYEAQEMMAVVAVHLVDSAGNVLGRLELDNAVDFLRQLPGSTVSTGRPTKYRTRREGSDVYFNFYPEPAAGDILLVTYVPAPKALVLTSDEPTSIESQSVNYPMGWEERIVLGMTRRAKRKADEDTRDIERDMERLDQEIVDLVWSRTLSEAPTVRNADRRITRYTWPTWQSWAWL